MNYKSIIFLLKKLKLETVWPDGLHAEMIKVLDEDYMLYSLSEQNL